MKGFIRSTLLAALAANGLAMLGGCACTGESLQSRYWRFVDPCWPDRYTSVAAKNVRHGCRAQAANGHVLDQTVWNYHFEPGKAILTPGGMEHLNYLSRRRPAPDPHVFLQTANDVFYDHKHPEKFVKARRELNQARIEAVMQYLNAQTADRPVEWHVTVHDPHEVGTPAAGMMQSLQKRDSAFQGTLPRTGSSGFGTTGGGTGGGLQ